MRNRITQCFIYTAPVILLVTDTAKLVRAAGQTRILNYRDPLLPLTSRHLLVAVACLELAVTAYLLFGRNAWMKLAMIAWLATNFLAYRAGLVWIGVHQPCWCLGNVTDALRLSPALVDLGVKVVLGFLLIGSYGLLACGRWQNRRVTDAPAKLDNQELPA